MWQRRQTLYLLAALVITVICLSLPLGHIEPRGMGTGATLYNLGVLGSVAGPYVGWPLFALLLATCPLNLAAIFLFRRRRLQVKFCVTCVVLCILWYAYLFHSIYRNFSVTATFHYQWTVILPLAAIVFYLLARSGIRHDEELLKSTERIR